MNNENDKGPDFHDISNTRGIKNIDYIYTVYLGFETISIKPDAVVPRIFIGRRNWAEADAVCSFMAERTL